VSRTHVELEAVKTQMARSSAVATKDTSSTATPDYARTITNAPILMLVQMDSASIYQEPTAANVMLDTRTQMPSLASIRMNARLVCVEQTQTVPIPKDRTVASVMRDSNSPDNSLESQAVLI